MSSCGASIVPIGLRPDEQTDPLAFAEMDVLGSDYLEQYLRRWLDEPNAQLEGATPRAAACTPTLRGEVELLLRSIENRAGHAARPGAAWPEVGWLRGELGLRSQLAA